MAAEVRIPPAPPLPFADRTKFGVRRNLLPSRRCCGFSRGACDAPARTWTRERGMRLWNKLMAAALLMAPMAAQAVPADVAAAVAVDARPADAVKLDDSRRPVQVLGFLGRSEERRVGKEVVSKWRNRGAPEHLK